MKLNKINKDARRIYVESLIDAIRNQAKRWNVSYNFEDEEDFSTIGNKIYWFELPCLADSHDFHSSNCTCSEHALNVRLDVLCLGLIKKIVLTDPIHVDLTRKEVKEIYPMLMELYEANQEVKMVEQLKAWQKAAEQKSKGTTK
jgi:hypothetical protein